MQHSTIAVAAVVAVVGWRLVVRVRRLVVRQESRLWRHRSAVLFLPFLVGLLFVGALGETESLVALAGGAGAGGVLALLGFRHTRLEVTDEGRCFYTPCGPIGASLAALLVIRIAYQGLSALESAGAGSPSIHTVALTPTTLFVFATLAIYYSAYSLGLLLWRARLGRQSRR